MDVSSISGSVYASAEETKSTWTKQQVAQLKDLVEQNMSLAQISQQMKRPQTAIKLEAAALGLNLNLK